MSENMTASPRRVTVSQSFEFARTAGWPDTLRASDYPRERRLMRPDAVTVRVISVRTIGEP